MKTVRLAAAFAGLALAPAATPALAQSLSPYGMWGDEPPAARRAPPPVYSDDDYDPPAGYRYGGRRDPRWAERGYDGRGGYGGYGYEQFPDDAYDAPPPGAYEPYDGPPSDEAIEGEVADGGARPEIAPVAPPVVAFYGSYISGSIVIDVGARKLYFVNGNATAYAYLIGVGRQGFGWTGTEKISRVADWPDWHPPKEMRERKPELPVKMTGGLNNPLGARAIYLGNTLYRIHGTNDPKSIGRAESSGCFRMMNGHVAHLASMAQVGADVSVVKSLGPNVATRAGAAVR